MRLDKQLAQTLKRISYHLLNQADWDIVVSCVREDETPHGNNISVQEYSYRVMVPMGGTDEEIKKRMLRAAQEKLDLEPLKAAEGFARMTGVDPKTIDPSKLKDTSHFAFTLHSPEIIKSAQVVYGRTRFTPTPLAD